MGREIRRVPPNWRHPTRDCQHHPECPVGRCFQPLHDKNFESAAREWKERLYKWEKEESSVRLKKYGEDLEFWECHSNPPDRDYYRAYKDEEATWYQVYETVSEGTPVSPPFETREELVDYLVKHGDFWDQRRKRGGYSEDTARKFVFEDAWVPSMVWTGTQLKQGIDCVDLLKATNPVSSGDKEGIG